MDQQPKIPTLKDAQKPQVKIKGMGAGLTLFDRLKQFKKKDLAFILAGLGTLFMAPLAEHFMMAPENGDSALQKGWGGGSGSGNTLFGSGSSPYESGNNGIASGGAIGGAGDIITPLNVRDPSALVMGPGAAQQPPAGSAAPATPPPTAPAGNTEDYKDALKGAASRAASAAVKRAPLPIPKVALGGSGLRGLGAVGGGSSAGSSLGPIGPAAGSNGGGGGSSLGLVHAAPNYRGAAGPRGNGPMGLDGTKKAGANAGDAFSRTGSAMGGLQQAASEQIPTGGTGFNGGGQGGSGANDKAPGGSGPGGSKSVGESLAFIEAKERMMENLKLEFEKRKLKDPELLLYGIRNDSLKAMASEMTKSLTKGILGFMDPSAPGANATISCDGIPKMPLSSAQGNLCPTEAGKPVFNCFQNSGSTWRWIPAGGETHAAACTVTNGKDDGVAGKAETAPSSAGGVVAGMPTGAGATAAANLKEFCDLLDKEITAQTKVASTSSIAQEKLSAANAIQKEVGKMVSKRDALYGTSTADSCKAEKLRTDKSVYEYQGSAVAGLLEEGGLFTNAGMPALVKAATDPKGKVSDGAITAAREKYGKAMELLQKADNVKIDGTPFETKLFVDGGGTFQRLIANAKTAKDGIDKYAADERELLEKKLNPLIQGAEFAGLKSGTPSVPEVVKVNASYDEMSKRATTAGVKPGDGVPAEAPKDAPAGAAPEKPDPKAEYDAVIAVVKTAREAVGESPTAGALAAVTKIEEAKKKDPKFEPTEADKKPINDAWKAWADMQKKQVQVLSDISGGLTDLKKGPATTPPAVAAN
ncbi:MAG: hypothetical protein PHS14_06730 [Elusimicrobia bacterium]|nr:hypothetical protein [Elusimicrobiota bacterium]